jgi:2,4-dienoyl-CoA reductase-like NADH-dependent reductase (Old Yellow Enzyme family)
MTKMRSSRWNYSCEIHGTNGYLIQQFLQDTCNQRVDGYGGSAEGRTMFAKEIVKAVVDTVGEKKTGIRLSPWNYAGGPVVSLVRLPLIDRCPG